ncbi:MAG: glycoside hydrolase family 92 protein, partial [Porphyromonadaceae bacterium]
MRSLFIRLFILCFVFGMGMHNSASAQSGNPVDYVNPFIGTDFFGHTFPGASLPFAMVHLSPDINTEGWTYCAGYIYSESSIMGFSHTHWSGTGMVSGGDVLLMPTVGNKLQTLPGSLENPEEGYRSRFNHADEIATPGYYSVLLKDDNIKVELTSTLRAGFHRYTFPKAENSRVILDLGHQIGANSSEDLSELKILNNYRIEGVKSAGLGKVYFVAEFNKPFAYYGTFDNDYKTPES